MPGRLELLLTARAQGPRYRPSTHPCHTGSQSGECPAQCRYLPDRQRSAASLAVSMVVLLNCRGDIDSAAKAIASAAGSGSGDVFTAGLSVGLANLEGAESVVVGSG